MKQGIKRHVSESTRRRARQLGRLRWVTKTRVARREQASLRQAARYVLLDPEVDSFTFSIANRDELASALTGLLPASRAEIERYLQEPERDQTLRQALTQPLRRRLWSKHHPKPSGYHLICWAAIRTIKPDAVVETGILNGMASVTMLVALERNRAREICSPST